MPITKQSNDRYLAVVNVHGRQKKKRFDRKIDAERWYDQVRVDLANTIPGTVVGAAPNLKSFAEGTWLRECLLRAEESTRLRYDSYLRLQILPKFGIKKLDALTVREADSWLSGLRLGGLSAATANGALAVLKKMLTDATRWGLIRFNPVASVKPLPEDDQEMQFWSMAEARTFLAKAATERPAFYNLAFIALNTGMRLNEIVGLKWDCIDLGRGFITVKRQWCEKTQALKERTKGKRIRQVPLNAGLRDLLVKLQTTPQGDGYVLPRHEDYRHSARRLSQVAKAAGVKVIRFHDLRHTFAANWMMSGGAIYKLQKVLGHASIQMTEKYAHLAPEHLKGATDFLDLTPESLAEVIPIRQAAT